MFSDIRDKKMLQNQAVRGHEDKGTWDTRVKALPQCPQAGR